MELAIVDTIRMSDLRRLGPSVRNGGALDDSGEGTSLLGSRTLRGELRAESLGLRQDDEEILDLLPVRDDNAAADLRNDLQEALRRELLERFHDRLAAASELGDHFLDADGVAGSEGTFQELLLKVAVRGAGKANSALLSSHASILALHSGNQS